MPCSRGSSWSTSTLEIRMPHMVRMASDLLSRNQAAMISGTFITMVATPMGIQSNI